MKQSTINYFFYGICAVFTITYFYLVYSFTINIPMNDDLLAIQNFLIKYIHAESIQEKITLLIEPHGIHRILLLRLTVLLIYALSGELNYSICIFICGLLLAGTGLLLCKTIHEKSIKGLCALLIVLLLYNGQNFMNSLWAMSGLANIGICFYCFLVMYLLLLPGRIAFTFGLFLSLLTIYSNGNGMLIIPPVIACLYIQKRMKKLIVFAVPAVIMSLLYFYQLNTIRISNESIWSHYGSLFEDFFIFIGGNLWIPSMKIISIMVGLFCLSIYVWGIFKKLYEKDLFCYACLTFLYLSAIAVAVGSTGPAGTLRYRIYGSLFMILTVILLINNTNVFHLKRRMVYLFSILALFFSIFSTTIYSLKMEKILEWKKISAYNWLNKGEGLANYTPDSTRYETYLEEAEQMGIYKMPQYPLSEYKSVMSPCENKDRKNQPEHILYEIESIEEKEIFFIVEGWAYFKSMPMEFTDIYLYLINEETCLSYHPMFVWKIHRDISKSESGFFAVIDKTEIPAGTYRIEIGIKSQLKLTRPILYVSTDRILEI
jgi:hypothetical protein